MSIDNRRKLIEGIHQARVELASKKLSRRAFTQILGALGAATGFSVLQVEEANAWVGTRMRKSKRDSSGSTGNSLRFDSARSTCLTLSPSVAGNRSKWTYSTWTKRTQLSNGSTSGLLGIYSASTDSGNLEFRFNTTDELMLVLFNYQLKSTQVFRDTSAWYHIVLAIDAAAAMPTQRARMYVNGIEITSFSVDQRSSFPSTLAWNQAGVQHNIGRWFSGGASTYYLNGLVGTSHMIDGDVLTPWSFADIDPATGQYIPKTYSGSYGTNGFYLPFNDGTNTTTLGYDRQLGLADSSKNNWTLSGHAVTDLLLDSPVNNFAIPNRLNVSSGATNPSFSHGSLKLSPSGSDLNYLGWAGCTQVLESGKWYWEITSVDCNNVGASGHTAITQALSFNGTAASTVQSGALSVGQNINAGSSGTTIGFAYDAATGKFWHRNGSGSWTSGDPAAGTSPVGTLAAPVVPVFGVFNNGASYGSLLINLGQGGQSGLTYDAASGGSFKYTPPSGFKALTTANLPAPAIAKPGQYFQAITYTGNGGVLRVGEIIPATQSYQVARSLRFNGTDTPYLSRTPPSAGNRTTFTWSGWVKRSTTGAYHPLFTADTNNMAIFWIYNNGELRFRFDSTNEVKSARLLNDTSEWHHLVCAVDTTQATATDRVKIYLDGTQLTLTVDVGAFPSSGQQGKFNSSGMIHTLGYAGGNVSDGYLAEVHFVDGQALGPSSFAAFDSTSGDWVPKVFSGGYGATGYYLNFSDNSNTTAGTLGKDLSGNNNDWTPTGFSVAAGAGNDSLTDSPTSYGTDSGGTTANARGNYCVLDTLTMGAQGTLTNGSLEVSGSANNDGATATGTLSFSSGKWYAEFTIANTYSYSYLGLRSLGFPNDRFPGHYAGESGLEIGTGQVWVNTTGAPAGYVSAATYTGATAGQTVMMAVDMDSGKLWFGINGTWFASGNPGAGTGAHVSGISGVKSMAVSPYASSGAITANFGQRPFSYAPPTGFKCLNTRNLPAVDSRKMTGTPDLVWIKSRSAATDHSLFDSVRGAGYEIQSNQSNTQTFQSNGVTQFTKTGFTISNLARVNTAAATYAGWMWKKGAVPGFDIVTYVGNGGTRTIAHALATAPAFMAVKSTSHPQNWMMYHTGMGPTKYVEGLNTTSPFGTSSTLWNNTAPTTSNFTIATEANVNGSGRDFVAYLWAEVPGFSKFSLYTGNGAADGPFVWCGFRPAYVLTKRADSASNWYIWDCKRSASGNGSMGLLLAEATTVETAYAAAGIDLLANGFKLRNTDSSSNASGGTYIFIAFAEAPFKYALAR